MRQPVNGREYGGDTKRRLWFKLETADNLMGFYSDQDNIKFVFQSL